MFASGGYCSRAVGTGDSAVAKPANMAHVPLPDLGQRLREIRHRRGLSQAKLAKVLGLTTGAVQAYEHGRARVTVDRLLVLAAALGCEPAELLAPPGTARAMPRDP
jgi:ribosome-binding protein aMBF1 (putative translation factor)